MKEAEDIAEDRFGTEELKDLAEEMISTMRAAPGVGLAAPQIGLGQKVLTTGRQIIKSKTRHNQPK